MNARRLAWLGLVVAAGLAAGCRQAPPRVPRLIGAEVLGALTPAALREAYRTPAFVVRGEAGEDGRPTAVQDTDLAEDDHVDDTNLLLFVEGAGDTVEGFRYTGRLLAESPLAFEPGAPCPSLAVVLVRWCQSSSPVVEHLNRKAQEEGAARLAAMLEVHRRRHPSDGHVSLIGFSAGTRVIEIAITGAASGDPRWVPDAFRRVDHVVSLGSSLGSEETLPMDLIRGRFVNFVNPRDTHFGDRAAYVAPAGGAANPLNLLRQATLQRRPRFGASVAGFLALPVLTAPDQFDAVEAMESHGDLAQAARAFKQVNVPVPPTLVPYNLFGRPILDDDLDDYLNLAPNHYILVGRGAAGRTDLPTFKQYRATAAEFVQEHVAAAALHGRLHRFDLRTVPKGADPLGLPLPLPWAILAPAQQPKEEPPKEGTAPPPEPPDVTPPGAGPGG